MRTLLFAVLALGAGPAQAQPVAPTLEDARVVLHAEPAAPSRPLAVDVGLETPAGLFWPAVAIEAGAVLLGVAMVVGGVEIYDDYSGIPAIRALGVLTVGLGSAAAGFAGQDLARVSRGADPALARVGRRPPPPETD